MVSQQEAQRLAAAINVLRPDWRVNLILAVLGDEKCIKRPYQDLAIAMTAVACDPASQKPGRIHEAGPWWNAAIAVAAGPTPVPRYTESTDCAICHGPRDGRHDDHDYREPLPREEWARPTPEQKEYMRLAAEKAERERTAAPTTEEDETCKTD